MNLIDKNKGVEFNQLWLLLTKEEAILLSNQVEELLKINSGHVVKILGQNLNGEYTKKVTLRICPPRSESPVLFRTSEE